MYCRLIPWNNANRSTYTASYYGRLEDLDKVVVQENISTLLSILEGAKDTSTKEAVFNAVGQISASGVLAAAAVNECSLKATGKDLFCSL